MSDVSKRCPSCGEQASGNFCSSCGSALGSIFCNQCGASAAAGARFCNACGAALGAGPVAAPSPPDLSSGGGAAAPDSSRAAWWVAGALLAALVIFVAIPAVQRSGAGPDPAVPTAPIGGAVPPVATTDISQMTPIQAADALYDRVMRASSAGDSAQVTMFLPMAVAAYDRARPLDADGLFHLSLLQRMALDPDGALASAEAALTVHPDHLLHLGAAAGAAVDLGDTQAARDYYRRFLDAYDTERGKGLDEYEAHESTLTEMKAEAEAYLGG